MSVIFDGGIFDVSAEREFFSLAMSKLMCVIITYKHTHTYIHTHALHIHTHTQ